MKTKEEIEQLAFLKYPIIRGYIANNMDSEYDKNKDFRDCFIKGYTQCQEDMADKKYTEEDLMSAFNAGINNDYGNGPSFDKWLNSLNKQD
jgi:hypothetical protein